MKNILKSIMMAVAVVILSVATVKASIIIIDEPIERRRHHPIPIPQPRPLPGAQYLDIKSYKINVDIKDQTVKTEVNQEFINNLGRQVEGTFIFPLPDEASVSKFSLEIDGKMTDGKIMDQGEARRIYESIVMRQRDPALLEYMGRKLFQARIFPVPANGTRKIKLVYYETLKADQGVVSYTYPLNTAKFSSNPISEFTFAVKINSNAPIKTVYSPTFADQLSIHKDGEHKADMSIEAKNVKPDKDFVLYYTYSREDVGLHLITHKNGKEDGYFLLFIAPKVEVEDRIIPKDIIFLLDTSGSMSENDGKKLIQAKSALKFCINNLNSGDRFNIANFATSIETFKPVLVDNTKDNREAAMQYISELRGIGGTNINEALLTVLGQLKDKERMKIIVFLTDGLPTVGEQSIGSIVSNVQKENDNKDKTRIFAFGVGYDVNTHLLDKIAGGNQGVSEYVKPEEDLEVKVSALYAKISSPLLTNLKLDFGKIRTYDVFPKEIPDLFKGSQLILTGRYKEDGHVAVTLTGETKNKKHSYSYDATFAEEEKDNSFVGNLWATRKIGYLLDEIRMNGAKNELVSEIRELGLKFGVVTPYTSYLVEEPLMATRWGMERGDFLVSKSERKEILMGQRPGIVGGEVNRKMLADKGESGMNLAQGVGSYKAAEAADGFSFSLKEKADRNENFSKGMKHINSKTFYFVNNFWMESGYKEEIKTEEIEYLSEKYFKILNKYPEIGKYMALGENVIFKLKNVWYKIK